MKSVGNYLNIKGNDLFFSGCAMCDKRCCDGRTGFAMAPLIVDDFKEVYKHFPIVFGNVNEVFRPLMLLNDGNSPCSYLDENGQCRIYEKRPPACKLYPLSPFFDEIYIDTNCPSVNNETVGECIVADGKVQKRFYHERLQDFSQKLEKTSEFMKELVKNPEDFEPLGEVKGVLLYKYIGDSNDPLVLMHHESLLHLE